MQSDEKSLFTENIYKFFLVNSSFTCFSAIAGLGPLMSLHKLIDDLTYLNW